MWPIIVAFEDPSKSEDEMFTELFGENVLAYAKEKSELREKVITTRKALQAAVAKDEKVLTEIHRNLVSKNYEQSPKFRKTFEENERSAFYNYRIEGRELYEQILNKNGKVRFPAKTRTYQVNTPLLITIDLIKENGAYKIFALWLCCVD